MIPDTGTTYSLQINSIGKTVNEYTFFALPADRMMHGTGMIRALKGFFEQGLFNFPQAQLKTGRRSTAKTPAKCADACEKQFSRLPGNRGQCRKYSRGACGAGNGRTGVSPVVMRPVSGPRVSSLFCGHYRSKKDIFTGPPSARGYAKEGTRGPGPPPRRRRPRH